MSLAGEAVVAIWHDLDAEAIDDYYAWHVHEHMPERVGIPGFLRGRRYVAERASLAWFHFYEALTLETLAGQDYQTRLNSPTPWTLRVIPHFHQVSRVTQRVLHTSGPGIGGHMLTVRFEVEGDAAACRDRLRRGALATLAATHGVCGAHLCASDLAVSSLATAEKAARGGDTRMPGWTLMVETASAKVLAQVEREVLNPQALAAAGVREGAAIDVYRLEYVRTKTGASP